MCLSVLFYKIIVGRLTAPQAGCWELSAASTPVLGCAQYRGEDAGARRGAVSYPGPPSPGSSAMGPGIVSEIRRANRAGGGGQNGNRGGEDLKLIILLAMLRALVGSSWVPGRGLSALLTVPWALLVVLAG